MPPLPPAPRPRPDLWAAQRVPITFSDGKVHWLEALVYGRFAVHKCANCDCGKWALTSISSGVVVVYTRTEGDAMLCGEFLWGRFCLAFREDSREKILARLPEWVRVWGLDCFRRCEYADPAVYEPPPDGQHSL